MRRSIVAAAVSLAVGVTVLTGGSPTVAAAPAAPTRPAAVDTTAQRALAAARGVLADVPLPGRRAGRPDATLALRDLFGALPRLDAAGRSQAHILLARPTDGSSDPLGDGYTVPSRKKCENHFCIHWVTSTADAPPSQAWVDTTLHLMNAVWAKEIGGLGYRAPASDGQRGGNSRFDVYLKELGSRGLYGYCAPERRVTGHKWLASGYCVLDNDFSRSQYQAPPRNSLRVTAAHEFFHAIQFNYDYAEDPWLMEATATWMEERVADDVDDNRQYLPFGQVGSPAQSLDVFKQAGFNQYGNWPFFEYLSDRFGTGIVRTIWTAAGAYKGSGRQYSTAAVKTALARHGGFVKVFRGFSAGNTMPGRTYPEGRTWPSAPASATWRLSASRPRTGGAFKINHMAARDVVVRPGAGVTTRAWQLRVTVDGPAGRTSPAAYLVLRRKHGITTRAIPLNGQGKGHVRVPFGSRTVRSATVTLVNASTRFSCWHRTTWSCQGKARDNRLGFAVDAVVRKARHG